MTTSHDHEAEDAHEHRREADHAHEHHDGDADHAHEHPSGLRGFLESPFRPHSHDATDTTDAALEASHAGMRALSLSLGVLAATAVVQVLIVIISGSVALLSATIHNFA